MIVDLTAIWIWITTVLIPLISLFSFVYLIRMNRRYAPTIRVAEKLIKQWGSLMTEKREEKKEFQKLTEAQKTSRSKIAKAIKEKVPFKILDKHTDNEIIALLGDKELMKGAMFLGKTGDWVAKKVVAAFTPKQKKEHGLDKIPTIT